MTNFLPAALLATFLSIAARAGVAAAAVLSVTNAAGSSRQAVADAQVGQDLPPEQADEEIETLAMFIGKR
jgi:hypothetical protein